MRCSVVFIWNWALYLRIIIVNIIIIIIIAVVSLVLQFIAFFVIIILLLFFFLLFWDSIDWVDWIWGRGGAMWITWRHPCCKPGLKRLTGINCCEWPTDLHRSGIEKVGVIDDNGNSCRIPGLLIFLLWTPRMEFFHLSGNPRVRRLKNVWLAPWHCYWFWCFDSIDLVSILTTSCFSISSLSPKRPIKCCLAQSSYMQYNKRKCPHGDEKYPHLTPPLPSMFSLPFSRSKVLKNLARATNTVASPFLLPSPPPLLLLFLILYLLGNWSFPPLYMYWCVRVRLSLLRLG